LRTAKDPLAGKHDRKRDVKYYYTATRVATTATTATTSNTVVKWKQPTSKNKDKSQALCIRGMFEAITSFHFLLAVRYSGPRDLVLSLIDLFNAQRLNFK
jgi:hypothetical protein